MLLANFYFYRFKLTVGKAFIQPEDQMADFPVKFYDFRWKVGIKSQQFWGASASSTPSIALQRLTCLMPVLILLFKFLMNLLSVMLFCVVEINYLED